ncbi:hypothetical protein [Pseudomonas sp. PK-RTE-24]
MSTEPDMVNIGGIHDMQYLCEPKEIFAYLDTIAPPKGSRFSCPVCSNNQWGCSTIGFTDESGVSKDLVAPCQLPLKGPNGATVGMSGKELPNYHYALTCLTCANTVFLNAAMVQGRIQLLRERSDEQS